jgi:hypothetical protein
MRSLLVLLILVGCVWLICSFFYSLGKRNATKSREREDEASTRRKKVESSVIENEGRGSRGDDRR